VVDESPPCEYAGVESIATATSDVGEPTGCGNQIISILMRTGNIVGLSIKPNPASNRITIASTEDISNARLEVVDAIGAIKYVSTAELKKSLPAELDVSSFAEGSYFLVVTAGGHSSSTSFVIKR
jgi:hypothetical protein